MAGSGSTCFHYSPLETHSIPLCVPPTLKPNLTLFFLIGSKRKYKHRHTCQIRTNPLLEGVRTDWKKFVTQLNWALYILWLFSISGSVYICLPLFPSLSLFFSLPLCLTFLCSVNCKLFPNATVSSINGKLNLAHIVLACTVCFIAQEMTLDVEIICTHCSQNVILQRQEESADKIWIPKSVCTYLWCNSAHFWDPLFAVSYPRMPSCTVSCSIRHLSYSYL